MLDMVKVEHWVELNVTQSVGSSTYPEDADENAAEIIWLTSPAEFFTLPYSHPSHTSSIAG